MQWIESRPVKRKRSSSLPVVLVVVAAVFALGLAAGVALSPTVRVGACEAGVLGARLEIARAVDDLAFRNYGLAGERVGEALRLARESSADQAEPAIVALEAVHAAVASGGDPSIEELAGIGRQLDGLLGGP